MTTKTRVTPKTTKTYENFWLKVLENTKLLGNQVSALCPFHDDSNPSFSANIETGEWYCHRCKIGGKASSFIRKMDQPHLKKWLPEQQIIKTYNYFKNKKLIHQTVRLGPEKRFFQRRPNENGGWIEDVKGIETVLYNYDQILNSNGKAIIICEGEKDCDRLTTFGYLATTCPMGAGKWREHYNEVLDNKDIVIIPDNDKAGISHLLKTAKSLKNRNKINSLKYRILPHSNDVSDYLDEYNLDKFKALLKNAKNFDEFEVTRLLEKYSGKEDIKTKTNEFYYYDVKKSSVAINRLNFIRLLNESGFAKSKINDINTFVKIDKNIMDVVSRVEVKDFICSYLENTDISNSHFNKDGVINAVMKASNVLFSDQQLEFLQTKSLDFNKDTKNETFIYFKNCIVKVDKNNIELIDYGELNKAIWKKSIINRNFKKVEDFSQSDFVKFLAHASGDNSDRLESIITAIGYLLSGYKGTSVNRGEGAKAVIFKDEQIFDDEKNGGSGKSLTAQAIAQFKNCCYIDAKKRSSNRFLYQRVNHDTQIIIFDDITKKFDFQDIYNLVTGDLLVERKAANEFVILFKESPKILITSNHVIRGAGDSDKRRKFEFAFSNYYNASRTPIQEFGREFFSSDWNDGDYLLFDNFMIICIQEYLKNDLIEFENEDILKSQIIAETSSEFVDFFEEIFQYNTRFNKTHLYKGFRQAFSDYDVESFKQNTFVRWLKKYAELYAKVNRNNIKESKSGNDRYIEFVKK